MDQYTDQDGQDQYTDQGSQDLYADQGGQDQLSDQDSQDQYGLGDQDQPAMRDASQAPGMFGQARSQVQDQLNQTIDGVAGRIPGGDAAASKAKEASGGLLDSLEHAAEEKLGGLFGHSTNPDA